MSTHQSSKANILWFLPTHGDGRYLGTTPRVVSNVNFVTEAPGYITGNLMAKYTVNEHLDLQVNIQNVSDAYYYDLLHPSHIVPGAGVGALFAASVKY